jgi:hypothetical protein
VLEDFAQFRKGVNKSIAVLKEYPLAIPILSNGIYHLGCTRKTNTTANEQGQDIYFTLDVSHISNLEL